jgi:hypothetical protein
MGNTINESQKFITLDGLETFYNKLQSKYTTPNWDAKKGENGYIENRTHYETAQDKTIYQSVCGYGEIYDHDDIYGVEVSIDGFYSSSSEGREVEVRFTDGIEYYTDWYELYSIPTKLVFYGSGNNPDYGFGEITGDGYEDIRIVDRFRGCSGYTEALEISNPYNVGLVCEYREKPVVTPLDDKYIPNTVLKTTPQTLSDDDKNQVKENLGLHDTMLNVTYLELKSLRDNSQLVPGQQYRITDYTTTTIQENTQSAGHQFDIIVVADDVNVLNENARAVQHDGDTYFSNSDLNAWELKYCLDNDTNRFAWADATNGKGVIYYMKDEFNNECPYDFKNIQFARWELSNPVGYRNDFDFDNWEGNWIEESTPFDSLKIGFYGLNSSGNVFTYVIDGDGGYYKYKVEYTISSSPTYCYTFGKGTDCSISGSNRSNVIKEYSEYKNSSNKIQLNNIVFLGNYCYSNSFGNYCYSNSFGNYCYSNSFGNNCNSNSFGNNCNSNSFGNYCYSNSFGNYCYSNSFGNYCYSNSFGNSCQYNSFGNNCYRNSFGNSCYRNSFGNECSYNSFGNECSYNSFGNECSYNSFGNNCKSNSFGNSCNSNSFGNNCKSNSFGNNCKSNSFGNSCNSNSFGNDCEYNSFSESRTNPKSYYRYIIFDNGNSYINLNCTSTTSSSKYYQNVRIGLGVNNTTISDNNVGQTYETHYRPTNSQTITV